MEAKELVNLVHREPLESLWAGLAEICERYFRVDVEGLAHIPRTGPVVITPNHSGFAGTDVIVLSHILRKRTERKPQILAHRAYFDIAELERMVSTSFGLHLASIRSGVEVLDQGEMLMIFPEGSDGNFKSTLKAYQLQNFHSGFLRMAVNARAPIVPTVVIGAEESHLNVGSLDISKFIKGYRLPIPVNFLPLPAKWKIRFLPPIDVSHIRPEELSKKEIVNAEVTRVRTAMQRAIKAELRKRKYIFHPRIF